MDFLNKVSINNDLLITTGNIDFSFLNGLIGQFFKNKSDNIFFRKNHNRSIYLIHKPSFFDIESLCKKTKILVSCHGPLTHISNHFNIKMIDIIEEEKFKFYINIPNNYFFIVIT